MHTIKNNTLAQVSALAVCTGLAGAMPPMGGPMNHLMVMREGDSLMVMMMDPTPMTLATSTDTYDAPADVLNGTAFNAQYGWMVEGFWSLPAGASLWIELQDQTPGLKTYEALTYSPIFGTDGSSSRYQWSGTMTHNWYAAENGGPYAATYSVYFGDATGEPIGGYTPASVTLHWLAGCNASDLAQPLGVLNIDDVLAFLNAFGAGDPRADLADGGGNGLDIDDVLAFLNAFSTGCP